MESINIDILAETLRGSSMTLEEGIESVMGEDSEYELSQEECEELDMIVLLCDNCGWWVEISDFGEEFCEQCEDF